MNDPAEIPPPKKQRTAAQIAAQKKAAEAAARRRQEEGLTQAQLDGLAHGRVGRRKKAQAAAQGHGDAYDPDAPPPVPTGKSSRRIVDTPYDVKPVRPKTDDPAPVPAGPVHEPVGTAHGPAPTNNAARRTLVDVVLIAIGVKEP